MTTKRILALVIIVILSVPVLTSHPQAVAQHTTESNLSLSAHGVIEICTNPINIKSPIYEGTMVVAYSNGTAGCEVIVEANGTFVGSGAVSAVGYGEIYLDRKLQLSEQVIAHQQISGSAPPYIYSKPRTVEKIPASMLLNGEQFMTPMVVPPITDCARGFRAEGYVPGARAGYQRSGSLEETGSQWTAFTSTFLRMGALLREDDQFTIWQDMDADFPQPSDPLSPPITVDPLPSQLPDPSIIEDVGGDGIPDVLEGTTILHLCGLFTGAEVTIYLRDGQHELHRIGGGIATAECNWAEIEPLVGNQEYCVRQSLCDLESEPGCVTAQASLNIPQLLEPLCPGDEEVIVTETAIGALVSIFVNGENGENATAPAHITVISLSRPLEAGDGVAVSQSNALQFAGPGTEILVDADCSPEEKPPVDSPSTPPNIDPPDNPPDEEPPSLRCGDPQIVCAGSAPSGYIKVDDGWDPTRCDKAAKYNIWTVEYYADCPIGTVMDVCGSAQIPPGWKKAGEKWSPTTCKNDSGAKYNIRSIRRDS